MQTKIQVFIRNLVERDADLRD